MRVIWLTTDFGAGSPYVGQMKAAIYSVNPNERVVDFYHELAPQNIRQAAWFLANFVLPDPSSIHICVVDPGVGTLRDILLCKCDAGLFIAPDNGVLTRFVNDSTASIVVLDRSFAWNEQISNTFHGRDIMAPVAAHLSLGENWRNLGTPISRKPITVELSPSALGDSISGEIMMIDRFGKAVSNITRRNLAKIPTGSTPTFSCGSQSLANLTDTYGSCALGEPIALIGSGDWLEFAITGGNFASMHGVHPGDRVTISW